MQIYFQELACTSKNDTLKFSRAYLISMVLPYLWFQSHKCFRLSPGADVIYFTALSAVYGDTTAHWQNSSMHQKVNNQLRDLFWNRTTLFYVTKHEEIFYSECHLSEISYVWIQNLLCLTDSYFWGILGRNPQGMWLSAFLCLRSYIGSDNSVLDRRVRTCHSAQRPSQDVEPFWGLISVWWAASMTAFNSLWATFIMHCLLWALDQMYPRIFTFQPTCPSPLYTVTYIHGSFIHEFVCLLLGLSVSDKRAAARPDCSV